MESAKQPDGAESPTQPRLKRSRTGCLTCRTRRRKCDEGKPRCQMCISKDFECRYAELYQFLGKNNFTPKCKSNTKYSKVLFVSKDDKKQAGEDCDANRNLGPLENNKSLTPPIMHPERLDTETQDTSFEVEHSSSPSANSCGFGLHGALALGTGNGCALSMEPSVSPEDLSTQNLNASNDQGNANLANAQEFRNCVHGTDTDDFSSASRWQPAEASIISDFESVREEYALELLKYYRYNVAPWLDMIDLKSSFGCQVLQLSAKSNAIRYGLLALADASSHIQDSISRSPPDIALMAVVARQREGELGVLRDVLLDILCTVKNAITDLSDFWVQESLFATERVTLESIFYRSTSRPLASSIFWLAIRIELSVALVNMSPCRLGVPPPAPAMQAYFVGVKTGDILEYSTWAIALCVDAALFAQGDEHGYLEQRYGRNRVEVWTTLVRSLEIWYAQRPHEFQAIIELYPRDGKLSDDEFPTLVFTNGAAILANQLHHTGMLLLLQNKPRFTGPMNLNSSFRSALWHTHRICGIATNNDRAECWDPSLLASFLVAARLATHRSQHTVIISSLERVCKLTGWNISHQINILEHKWRLAEG